MNIQGQGCCRIKFAKENTGEKGNTIIGTVVNIFVKNYIEMRVRLYICCPAITH